MRINSVLERLQDISKEACESQIKALALFASADMLLGWLEDRQKAHGLGGTFSERYASIRGSMERLAGLSETFAQTDERIRLADAIRQDVTVLRMSTLFGQRPDLLEKDLID